MTRTLTLPDGSYLHVCLEVVIKQHVHDVNSLGICSTSSSTGNGKGTSSGNSRGSSLD